MGTNVSKATGEAYRGFIVPDPEITLSTDPADRALYTQANPRPGSPVAYRQTDMVLETSGDSMTGSELHLATIQGGMPGVQEAGFVWTNKTPYTTAAHSAAGGAWRGWDAAGGVSQFEGQIGAPNDVDSLSCITLQSGIILVAARETAGSAVRIFKRSTAGVWTNALLGPTSSQANPCFLQLPEGRIHLYMVFPVEANYDIGGGTINGDSGQVRLYISDDDATTWTSSTIQCLGKNPASGNPIQPINLTGSMPDATAISGECTIRRMRVCYANGQVLLLIAASHHNDTLYNPLNEWHQYASSDLGHNFDLIEKYRAAGTNDTHSGGFHDIVAPKGGGFLVVYNTAADNGASAEGGIYCKRFSSAYQAWSTLTPEVVKTAGTGVLTAVGASFELREAECAVGIDQTGVIAVSWQLRQPRTSFIYQSFDDGVTWKPCVGDYGSGVDSSWYNDAQIAAGAVCKAYPRGYCATFQWGRFVIISLSRTGAGENGTDAYRPMAFYLGGYTSITRPFKYDTRADDSQMCYEINWMAFNRLNDEGEWTRTAVGVPAVEALNNGFYRVVTGAGVTLAFQNVQLTATSTYMFFLFEWNTVAGNSDVKIRVSNGAQGFETWVTMTTTNIIFKDIVAGTTLATVARPSTGQNQVYVCIDRTGLKMRAGYRAGSTSEDRGDFVSTASFALADSGAVAAGDRVILYTQQNSTIDWNLAQWGSGVFGQNPEATFPNTDNEGRGYKYWRSFSPYPLYVNGGVSVAAVDGPSWPRSSELSTGDRWDITPRYEYAIENTDVFVTPTPRKTWRSTTDTVDPSITFNVGGGLYDRTTQRVVGIGLFNCNFKEARIEVYIAGVWTVVSTVNLRLGGGNTLTWVWDGTQVTGQIGVKREIPWITHSSLVGSHFKPASPALATSITANSEGNWDDPASVNPVLRVKASAANTSGSGATIWMKDSYLILDTPSNFSKIRIIPRGGETENGYYEIGTIVIGDVEFFGKQYARGRSITTEQNYNLTTGRSGTRRGRKLGPTRRVVEFSWANENLIDSSQIGLEDDTVSPDYILNRDGSKRVASPADTAHKISGLVSSLSGGVVPAVYLSRISNSDYTGITQFGFFNANPNEFMLCRVTSDPRIETVAGNEWDPNAGKGEIMRIATVTLEEEI